MFGRLNKRRRHLLFQLVKRTRLNKDLLLYVGNRIKWMRHNKYKNTVIPHPTNGMIELGNVCNLHCQICPREYEYGKAMDQGFMPLDKALSLLQQMIPYLDSIGLTGLGETIMYPHLLEVLQYIKGRKPSVVTTISTNAHFPGYLKRMEPLLPYLDNIQFSVDGIGKMYEEMRPGTDFDFITDNIKQTISLIKDTTFMINFVVSEKNYKDMANVIRFADSLGVKFVNFNKMSIVSMPDKDKHYYKWMFTEDFKLAMEDALNEISQHPDMEVTGLPMTEGEHHEFQDCLTMWQYPYITWDGYYVPCCGKPFPKLLNFGNVHADGFYSVINSKEAQDFRRLWQKNVCHKFCHNCSMTNYEA